MDEVEALCDEICILKQGAPAFLGIGLGGVLPPICVMLALTALCTLLSLRFFRWE